MSINKEVRPEGDKQSRYGMIPIKSHQADVSIAAEEGWARDEPHQQIQQNLSSFVCGKGELRGEFQIENTPIDKH